MTKPLRTRWTTLAVVCRECATCKDSTSPINARKLMKLASKGGKVRVVTGSCLGICPKAGVTISVCGTDGATTGVARSKDEVNEIADRLR